MYLHSENSEKDNEVQNVKGLPDRQTEVDGLGDVTDENKHLDSAQKEGSEEATKTVMVGYTVTCLTTSIRNKLHLENIQAQNMTKVKNVLEDHTILDHMELKLESQKIMALPYEI